MTLNNAMSITSKAPAEASREKFKHGSNLGSDALSMKPSLCETDDACFEQVELPSAIHLAFDQLKLADLSFGLPV